MSYLVRRAHLDEVKGLSYFGRFLAEDFFLAKYLHERQVYLLYMTVCSYVFFILLSISVENVAILSFGKMITCSLEHGMSKNLRICLFRAFTKLTVIKFSFLVEQETEVGLTLGGF